LREANLSDKLELLEDFLELDHLVLKNSEARLVIGPFSVDAVFKLLELFFQDVAPLHLFLVNGLGNGDELVADALSLGLTG